MEELLLSCTTRYKAGLVIKTNGTKNFILSGKTTTLGGRTAGKVIIHTHSSKTQRKLARKSSSLELQHFFTGATFSAAANTAK